MTEVAPRETRAAELSQLETAVHEALDLARAGGATSAEAAVNSSIGLSVNVRMGEIETVEHTRDRGLGITVYCGQRKGSSSTSDFTSSAIRESVEAACRIARLTDEDDCAGLADADRMATEFPALDLYHPWEPSVEEAAAIALEAEAAARDVDPRITNSEGAGVNYHMGHQVYGNSHGFIGGVSGSRHSVSCAVIASDDDGMQRDYWYTVSRNPAHLENAAAVGRRAGERTVARLGAAPIATGTMPVLFAPEVAGGMFRHLISAISGGNLYRGSSFLIDHVGKRIFPQWMRIHEQPHLPGAIGSSAFDAEGVGTVARDIVGEGVLRGYVLSSYSARKLGLETTGNAGGVHNLTIDPSPGAGDHAALIAEMGNGLLVTELMGMGINITNGDYSRGAGGFLVENGKLTAPVQEVTIAGNLRDIFANVRAVGTDSDERSNVRCGSLLIDGMTIAGS